MPWSRGGDIVFHGAHTLYMLGSAGVIASGKLALDRIRNDDEQPEQDEDKLADE